MWTRRELLTAALGVTATALIPATDVGRPGEEWVAEAANIDRRAEKWGPTATLANAAGLLHRLDVASPNPRRRALATGALWAAGASAAASGLRAAARWQVAWEHAATGDEHGALQEAEWATREAQRAGWGPHSLHIEYGQVLARCGYHAVAQHHLMRALGAPPVSRIVVLTDLALCQTREGDADAAATSLEEAMHLARACRAPGRIGGIRVARALLPPGRHRDQLDDVMRG